MITRETHPEIAAFLDRAEEYRALSGEYAKELAGLQVKFGERIHDAGARVREAREKAVQRGNGWQDVPALVGRFARVLPRWGTGGCKVKKGELALPIVLLENRQVTRWGGSSVQDSYACNRRLGVDGRLVYCSIGLVDATNFVELLPLDSPELKQFKRWEGKQMLLGKKVR